MCAPTIARITSVRSPGTMTRLRGPIRWSMCSGSIAPIATPPITWSRSGAGVERLAVDAFEDHRQGRVGQDRPVGQHAQQRDAVAREAALQGPGEARLGVEVDLVDDGARDVDAVPLEQRGVEHDLVDRAADAALGDDDGGRTEHRRDGRVREVDDGADAGVAGALDQQDVAVAANAACAARIRAARSSTTSPSM